VYVKVVTTLHIFSSVLDTHSPRIKLES